MGVWKPRILIGDPFVSNSVIFNDDQDAAHIDATGLNLPTIDAITYTALSLSYEYSLQNFSGDGFLRVGVYDDPNWVEVVLYD